ncbi:MAG: SDR family oxidoreductase [bacterium]|nr:SDR family oxidoreductase [bacterium]
MATDFTMFSLEGKTAVLIGGGGAIGSAIAKGMGTVGAQVVVCDLSLEKAEGTVQDLQGRGMIAKAYEVDALDKGSLEAACEAILEDWGQVDVLVNLAGGNFPEASTSAERSFFDLPLEALEKAIAINLFAGAILPTQVFAKRMIENEAGGSIINTSSMNAFRPLTRIPGYSAGKAAVSNFTQWLAVHIAQEYTPKVRVNAIAPGFFLTDQNRYLLYDKETGALTERGETVVGHTPMGRLGDPEDVAGAAVWLASSASEFVTGVVLPVDGGFSAFSGV